MHPNMKPLWGEVGDASLGLFPWQVAGNLIECQLKCSDKGLIFDKQGMSSKTLCKLKETEEDATLGVGKKSIGRNKQELIVSSSNKYDATCSHGVCVCVCVIRWPVSNQSGDCKSEIDVVVLTLRLEKKNVPTWGDNSPNNRHQCWLNACLLNLLSMLGECSGRIEWADEDKLKTHRKHCKMLMSWEDKSSS